MYELVSTLRGFTVWSYALIPILYYLGLTWKNQNTPPPMGKVAPLFFGLLGLDILVYSTLNAMNPDNAMSVSQFVAQIIPMFFVQFLSYQLFFFNVPYRAGEELRELSENRIYKSGYYIIAGVGRGISGMIEAWTEKNVAKTGKVLTYRLCNLLIYVFVVYYFTYFYEILSMHLLQIKASQFTLRGNFLDFYYNFQLLYAIVSAFEEVTGIFTFFGALKNCFRYIVFYQLLTLFYFTSIYGLLESNLDDLVVLKRNSSTPVSVQPYTLGSLVHLLKEGLFDFVGSLSYMKIIKNAKVLVPFSLIVTIFGMFSLLRGGNADMGGMVYQIVEATNLIHVLISFFVGLFFVKTTDYAGHAVYVRLPPEMQQRIDAFGDQLEEWETEIRQNNASSPTGDAISRLRYRVEKLKF